jgi:hypothetical protein
MIEVLSVSRGADTAGTKAASRWSRLWLVSLIYSLVVIGAILYLNRNAADYVGADNDDVMRLVEVRDFLGGQGWFDMIQYRLGLEGGTLMHWSRFIDLPIAALIAFFRLFLVPERAEAAALTVWPLALIVPLMVSMGLAGRRIAGTEGMHFSLGLAALLIVTSRRFFPGSIDHDNVQLGLAALATAMLIGDKFRPRDYAVAAVALAVALGIGAETTPFVAVACMAVAAIWAWEGEAAAPAVRAFALTLTLAVSAAFFALVPPHLYSAVTCDNLSLGFYGMTVTGSAGLLVSALFASRLSRPWRCAVLALNGGLVLATTVMLAPQCLRSPLADLDPMLVKLWLNQVTEAQSILALARNKPETIGALYATGLFAAGICVMRMLRGDRTRVHAVLLALLLVNWAIAAVQVRGGEFANLLAVPPLALLLAELRRISAADTEDVAAAFFYVTAVLISTPVVWAVGAALAVNGMNNASGEVAAADDAAARCTAGDTLAPIARLDAGVVSAPSNMGAALLRFTPHRALSGPYHRDQAGMLREFDIELAKPEKAKALLRDAHVTLLAFCPGDAETSLLSRMAPDGLYAELGRGRIPAYLEPLAATESAVKFFRVAPSD